MPKLSQGNVFEAIDSSRAGLAVVFGHVGFNQMSVHWTKFSARHPQLTGVRDPFTQLPNLPVQISNNTWLWFIPEETNHGMTDTLLTKTLDSALSWASRQNIKSVFMNGVANTNHGNDTAHNRQSDEQRARFLTSYARLAEEIHGINIELVSLNDTFIHPH